MTLELNLFQPELFPDASGGDGKTVSKGKVRINKEALVEAVPEKSSASFKTISEVAKILDIPQYVLRFWETKFKQIKPTKLRGGRRYYRPEDIEILLTIKHLLYKEGYTIKGARKAYEDIRRGKMQLNAGLQSAPKKKSARPAPLLQPAQPTQSAQAIAKEARKKKELSAIRDELLALKDELKQLR